MVHKGVRSTYSKKTRENVIFTPEAHLNPPNHHASSLFPHPREQETFRSKSFHSLGHALSHWGWKGGFPWGSICPGHIPGISDQTEVPKGTVSWSTLATGTGAKGESQKRIFHVYSTYPCGALEIHSNKAMPLSTK